jgi:hypothetical protein
MLRSTFFLFCLLQSVFLSGRVLVCPAHVLLSQGSQFCHRLRHGHEAVKCRTGNRVRGPSSHSHISNPFYLRNSVRIIVITAGLQVRAQAKGRYQPEPWLRQRVKAVREGKCCVCVCQLVAFQDLSFYTVPPINTPTLMPCSGHTRRRRSCLRLASCVRRRLRKEGGGTGRSEVCCGLDLQLMECFVI